MRIRDEFEEIEHRRSPTISCFRRQEGRERRGTKFDTIQVFQLEGHYVRCVGETKNLLANEHDQLRSISFTTVLFWSQDKFKLQLPYTWSNNVNNIRRRTTALTVRLPRALCLIHNLTHVWTRNKYGWQYWHTFEVYRYSPLLIHSGTSTIIEQVRMTKFVQIPLCETHTHWQSARFEQPSSTQLR